MSALRGIFLKLCAVVLFLAMASLIKATAGAVPPGEAVFFRSFFAFPIIIGWLAIRGELATGFSVQSRRSHVLRGVVGTSAMALSFASLWLLPLPEVTAIRFASPLFVVVFAALLLGEQVRLFRLSCVGVGFLGVMIVMAPRFSDLGDLMSDRAALGAALALAAAALAALAHVFIRKMVRTETTSSIVFWFTITSTCLALLTSPFGWVWPGWQFFGFLVLAGLFGGMGQILLTSAYRYADAAVIAPFDYASMLLAIVVGYAVFDEVPTPEMLLGACIVMMSGAAIIWRERQLGLKRSGKARSGGA